MEGAEIKRRRQALGMTPQQFADAVGVSLRTVTNWESGATSSDRNTGRIEQVLAAAPPGGDGLAGYDDAELLTELLARVNRRRKERTHAERATIHALPGSGKTRAVLDSSIYERTAADPDTTPTDADLRDDDE